MAVNEITDPAEGASVKVFAPGEIRNVKGKEKTYQIGAVKAKVVRKVTFPAKYDKDPPADAVIGTPAGNDYTIDKVSGAQLGEDNALCVWVQAPVPVMQPPGPWSLCTREFKGIS